MTHLLRSRHDALLVGINTVLVGDSPMPNLSEEIRVAEEDAGRAQQLIADALSAGPAGAAEAEAESER